MQGEVSIQYVKMFVDKIDADCSLEVRFIFREIPCIPRKMSLKCQKLNVFNVPSVKRLTKAVLPTL